jgi:PAS domain S-box-containing protein
LITVPLVLGWLRIRGQEAGLYDTAFGTALRTVSELVILSIFLWWTVRAVRARDVQRQRAEAELRDSERQLTHILESIRDGFIALDRSWRFTYVNSEAERLLGRPRGELLGRAVWEVFPQTIASTLYTELHRAVRDEVTVDIEGPTLGGGPRYFSHRVYPAADGELSVFFQDITQRKLNEDALKDADRRKDEFLATLAHELRNPLAPIRNAAKVLLAEDLNDSMRRSGAQIINRQVAHMARLLDDLLDVSRVSRGRLELRSEWVALASVIENAIEASRPAIDSAAHELLVSLPSESVYLNGDPVRLAQVFSNLLNNAAKYTEPGGHISLSAQCEGTEVVVRVRDDGIGIAAETLPQIFEMFAQAKPARQRSQAGLGIGLSLARALVELHGGHIEAQSAGEGKGSEFVVRLPRLMQLAAPGVDSNADPPATMARRRVLVVDDMKDSADSLGMLLRKIGHEVHVDYAGTDALETAARVQPEVIFLDLGMPAPDGFEVCRRIRGMGSWGRTVFIAALTGWGQAADRRRTEEAGFDRHLIKPIDPIELEVILGSAQQTRRSASAL